jgi:hypothetical protein
MAEKDGSQKNRRAFRRHSPRGKPKIALYKGSLDLGANLAVRLLDVSESGVRLLARAALDPPQEVTLTIEGMGHLRPIKTTGKVVWCVPADDGAYCMGIQFFKYIPYADLTRLT